MTRDNDTLLSMIRVLEGKMQAIDAKIDLLLAQTKPRQRATTWRDFVKEVQENMMKSDWKHPVTGRGAMYRDALKQANSMKGVPEKDLEEPAGGLELCDHVSEPIHAAQPNFGIPKSVCDTPAAVPPLEPVLELALTPEPTPEPAAAPEPEPEAARAPESAPHPVIVPVLAPAAEPIIVHVVAKPPPRLPITTPVHALKPPPRPAPTYMQQRGERGQINRREITYAQQRIKATL